MTESVTEEQPAETGSIEIQPTPRPVKKLRWASHRLTGISDKVKRQSTDFSKRHSHMGKLVPRNVIQEVSEADADAEKPQERRVYVNQPLPEHELDEDGRPKQHFLRNKIRTAKYTPLSFIPKNLWFQFQNVANIYFLFIILLSIFSVFGAASPGLAALPLIFILVVTAIKDAIEDYRRTVLDNELNNSPVRRLVEWKNVNVVQDNISWWRRVKKATTKATITTWRSIKSLFNKKKAKTPEDTLADFESRKSIETRATSRRSRETQRTSFQSTRSEPDEIALADVAPVATNATEKPALLSPTFSTDSIPRKGILKTTTNHSRLSVESIPKKSFDRRSAQSIDDIISEAPPTASGKAPQRKAPEDFYSHFYGSVTDRHREVEGKARFKKDFWKNVQVGDFVRIYNNDEIPADIVILNTSEPEGVCFIETKNLDGETNLKARQAVQCGREMKHAIDCERAKFRLESEPAHANLYSYSGVMRWEQKDPREDEDISDMAEAISINNLLLRGSSLRNTEWALGIVLFTGADTKIMLNAGVTPSKRSRITRELNWNVICNFGILFCMCLASGIVQGVTWANSKASLNFFEFGSVGGTPALDGFITFWSALILFQNLVPISLYISVEIIRTFQAYFIYSDLGMYYEPLDFPCTPKSWNISDDVGQIEYVFSDKTGTLTQNVMEFKKATINGVAYGEAYTEAQAGMEKRQGVDVEEAGARARAQIEKDRVAMLQKLRQLHDNPNLKDENLTFIAPDFVEDLDGIHGDEQKDANSHFMLAMALCHSVITEKEAGDPPLILFKAQSPDEAALVSTARDCGFSFMGRSKKGMLVNIMGEQKEYELLNTLEFNSSRKRMSTIVRMPDDGRLILFCKGADSMIYSRLTRGEQPELRKSTAEHLEMFAREGLRTLCLAQRVISEEQYREWQKRYEQAASSLEDRDDKIDEVADEIERDLTLLGGTAIEDRLQDGVPDTISLLAEGGIKLWVLTGDKVETAINIGFSCNLLNNDMDLIVLKVDEENDDAVEEDIDKHLKSFGLEGSDEELAQAKLSHEAPDPTHALIIDGDALKIALSEELRQKFLLLCKQCKSVLCCRVSPSQKAAVVRLVKAGLDVMTLSVGDGANDVAMIQEADVGVGIAGVEGRAAVMSSDYAIGQFRFLQRLVLVHGRWSYCRLAETVANFFYKNIVWTVTLFWYQVCCNFDCAYLFEYTYILFYNLAFTSLPVIVMGILDQDVSDKVSLAVPQLYRRGIERKGWTPWKFWSYMIDGFYQSAIVFFMTYLLFFAATPITASGRDTEDRFRMGIYVGHASVVVVNLFTLLNSSRWDWLILLIVSISTLLIWFWTGVYSSIVGSDTLYKSAEQVYGSLPFWVLTFLTVILCLTPRFVGKSIQKIFLPRDIDIIREQIQQGKFDYLNEPEPKPQTQSPPSTASSNSTKNRRASRRLSIFKASPKKARRATIGDKPDGDHEMRPPAPPFDRSRSSFDRMRLSMDRTRASYEASDSFTSAAMLTRMESSHSAHPSITSIGHMLHGSSRLRDSHQTSFSA